MAQVDLTLQPAGADMRQTRLLGFAPLAGVDALAVAMGAVAGPEVRVLRAAASGVDRAAASGVDRAAASGVDRAAASGVDRAAASGVDRATASGVDRATASGVYPMVAALVQDEPDEPLVGRGREALVAGLRTVQRRLEVGCQAGPFLAVDPAAGCCPSADVAQLLAAEWDALAAALALHGARQQWDIVLQWPPDWVVARHRGDIAPAVALGPQALADAVAGVLRRERDGRESALIAALTPVVLQFAGGGAACTETSVALTVLVAPGGEARVEAALDGMAAEHTEGASIDMRGPLPPVSFATVRVETVDERAVAGAWATLGLAERVDLAGLHRHWRMRAAAVHPDRQPVAAERSVTPTSADGARPGVADGSVGGLTDAYRLLRGLLAPGTGSDGQTLGELMARAGPRLVLPADGVGRVVADDDGVKAPVPELTA